MSEIILNNQLKKELELSDNENAILNLMLEKVQKLNEENYKKKSNGISDIQLQNACDSARQELDGFLLTIKLRK